MKGEIVGYDGDKNRITIQLSIIPKEIPLGTEVEIK